MLSKSPLVERLGSNEFIKIIKEKKIKHQVGQQRRKGHEQKEIYVLVEIKHSFHSFSKYLLSILCQALSLVLGT